MSNLPDFSNQGYQLVRELGQNRTNGRVTYEAISLRTQQSVAIKQFLFAVGDTRWSDYDTYQREIQVLQGLNHPGIPRYLDSFPTDNGFCLVQEYKNAPSLAVLRSFSPEEIKQIAVSVLEILVYLQNRIPTVIHRDIKPDNILVDDEINVYLVDFGLASIGTGEVTISSVAKGTLGFMAPEQLFHRQLTEASDLYGLGATLICLLTGTKSAEICNLIDDDYRLNFQHLVPRFSLSWIAWLEKLVQLKVKDRFANAAAALSAVQPVYVIRTPAAELSGLRLDFQAKKLGEKLTQVVEVRNSVPETMLQGMWRVVPHEHDPTPVNSRHSWISLSQPSFQANRWRCRVTVDTRYLQADRVYERDLLLSTNSDSPEQLVKVKLQTAPLPLQKKKLPLVSLGLLILASAIAAWWETITWAKVVAESGSVGAYVAVFVSVFMVIFGLTAAVASGAIASLVTRLRTKFKVKSQSLDKIVSFVVMILVAWFAVRFGASFRTPEATMTSFALVDTVLFLAVFQGNKIAQICHQRGFGRSLAIAVSCLSVAWGITIGLAWRFGWLHPAIATAIIAIGVPLVGLTIYPTLQTARLTANYRSSEKRQQLIKP
ncbi:MAG: serine/threonine-protein kinase [Oscillatoria sp. PMC 1068.18]|nr:serine/threonine-protein kinase [Oscillatoria sp. PMC 1076.18]MEC4991024.1 serine/threonine-protein kinase [Oscillatoria sp. PMC 1068.18]